MIKNTSEAQLISCFVSIVNIKTEEKENPEDLEKEER